MNALEALGYMGVEKGRIFRVRNKTTDTMLDYEELINGTQGLNLEHGNIVSEEWELGWYCEKCRGSGEIQIPCPRCSGKSAHQLMENPCCGGWDDAECPSCSDGIRWESEY